MKILFKFLIQKNKKFNEPIDHPAANDYSKNCYYITLHTYMTDRLYFYLLVIKLFLIMKLYINLKKGHCVRTWEGYTICQAQASGVEITNAKNTKQIFYHVG